MLGVGARQRGQHARRSPGGEIALAHRCEQHLGQRADELQAPADPTDIAATAPSDLALGEPLAVDQFAQQERFFQGRKRPRVGARQDRQQGLGEITRPGLHARGIAPEPAQCQDATIAVDQNQPVTVLGHRDARNELTVLLDGAGQRLHRPRLQ